MQGDPSTHSALGAAGAEVLKRSYRTDRVPFSMDSLTALATSPVRSFTTFTQAADENADSRVRAGIHFRFATEQGKALGREVGGYIFETSARADGERSGLSWAPRGARLAPVGCWAGGES